MAHEQLIKWAPGKSANPNGRPKGSPNRRTIARAILDMEINAEDLPETILDRLKQVYPDLPKSISIEMIMCLVQVRKAISGDTYAFDKLMNRAYGLPGQGTDEPYNEIENESQRVDSEQKRDLDEETITLYFEKLKERYE